MQTLSFPDTVSAREIQRSYSTIFSKVKRTNKPVVVMANNVPQAAIVSMKTLDKFNKMMQKEMAWEIIEQIRANNKDLDEEKEMDLITKEVKLVRQRRYGKTQGCS